MKFLGLVLLVIGFGAGMLFAQVREEGMQGMEDHSMADMVEALQGKTGDAFDQAFLHEMIPHHQGAIDMAELALENAKHDELKTMAGQIITAQQQEIGQMEQWMNNWGYSH